MKNADPTIKVNQAELDTIESITKINPNEVQRKDFILQQLQIEQVTQNSALIRTKQCIQRRLKTINISC